MWFSQRIGKTPIRQVLQVDSMDKALRNRLWNSFLGFCGSLSTYRLGNTFRWSLWNDFFKEAVDDSPHDYTGYVKRWFISTECWRIYDILEFCYQFAQNADYGAHLSGRRLLTNNFALEVNAQLEAEMAGYRMVDGIITPISDQLEIQALNEAVELPDSFRGARTHIRYAIEKMSDRNNPDYRNAIKEAICAIESAARIITGDDKATLGQALKQLNEHVEVHPALRDAFSKLYGYTSNEDGIRHAMLDDGRVDFADAKYMVVACSAFLKYLVYRASQV